MSESKADRWLSWVALATAIMAVLAAVTTLYMGKYSSRAILNQGQETSQWSYYQAKSIKSYIYEIQKQKLELEMMALGERKSAALLEKYTRVMAGYDQQILRYDKEKDEIKAKADALSKSKEDAQHRSGNFGYALIFIQISIMLSSISALTKKHTLFYLGIASLGGWLYFFVDAFLLFY